MIKKIDIPYYSQHTNVKGDYWQKRSCAIVCLKMIFDFYKNQNEKCDSPSIENLIREGIRIKGLDKNKDWMHNKIVMLLRNHGINSYQQEFKSMNIDVDNEKESLSDYSERILNDGLAKIIKSIENKKPILVSANKHFEIEKRFHMVILSGYKKDEKGELKGFYYIDPDYDDVEEGKNLFVNMKTFKKHWRRMAIFVE